MYKNLFFLILFGMQGLVVASYEQNRPAFLQVAQEYAKEKLESEKKNNAQFVFQHTDRALRKTSSHDFTSLFSYLPRIEKNRFIAYVQHVEKKRMIELSDLEQKEQQEKPLLVDLENKTKQDEEYVTFLNNIFSGFDLNESEKSKADNRLQELQQANDANNARILALKNEQKVRAQKIAHLKRKEDKRLGLIPSFDLQNYEVDINVARAFRDIEQVRRSDDNTVIPQNDTQAALDDTQKSQPQANDKQSVISSRFSSLSRLGRDLGQLGLDRRSVGQVTVQSTSEDQEAFLGSRCSSLGGLSDDMPASDPSDSQQGFDDQESVVGSQNSSQAPVSDNMSDSSLSRNFNNKMYV